MWLAVAAMAVASVARVESSIGTATVYTNPVLAFLAGHSNSSSLGAASIPQVLHRGSARKASVLQNGAAGAWVAMLPILFIGLVAPLSLISPTSLLSLGRSVPAPLLPSLFQRPPPALQ